MKSSMKRFLPAAVGLAAVAIASPVIAQGPPAMGDVTLPVDAASVGTKISAIGGTIMLICFGVIVAFTVAWKLFRRIKRAV